MSCRHFDFYVDELYADDDAGIACSMTVDHCCEQNFCEMPQQLFASDKQCTPYMQLVVDRQILLAGIHLPDALQRKLGTRTVHPSLCLCA